MKKIFCFIILLTVVFATASCKKEEPAVVTESDESYVKETETFILPEEICGIRFCMDGKNFIYDMINEETGERGAVGIINAKNKIPLTLFLTEEDIMSYCIDGGNVNVCTYNGDSYLVVKMDEATYEVKSHKEFDGKLFGGEYPLVMGETTDGKYIFMLSSAAVICDENNGECKRIACKEKEFINCTTLKDGNFALLSRGEDQKSYLAIYNSDGDEITGKTVFDLNIEFLCEKDDGILLSDGDKVISFDINTGKCEELISLSQYNLSRERVQGISYENEKIVVLSVNMEVGDKKGQLSYFKVGEGTEINLQTTIKLYSLWGRADASIISPTLIEDFEADNPRYRVEVINKTGYVDDLYLLENHPDILVEMFASNVDKYASSGYLEDLWPYIDSSDNLSRESLSTENTEVFEEDGKLYALPLYMSTSGIQIRSSQNSCNGSWTVEEYLDWLESHPEVRSALEINKDRVLEQCMKASIYDYVNKETGEVSFDTPEFCNILDRVSRMTFSFESGFDVYDNLAACKDVTYLSDGLNSNLENFALNEACFGEELSYLGFPNKDGGSFIKDCSTNMGIFSTSENKEAAYKFLEYWLTYDFPKVEKQEVSKGIFWTYEKAQEVDFEKVFLEHEMNGLNFYVTKKDYEILEKAVKTGCKQTSLEREILNVIKEEFESMETNGKSAEETAKIIQSRVYILVNE